MESEEEQPEYKATDGVGEAVSQIVLPALEEETAKVSFCDGILNKTN
jgi:hypothetical protein